MKKKCSAFDMREAMDMFGMRSKAVKKLFKEPKKSWGKFFWNNEQWLRNIQCSQISWFITNSAILGFASVTEISPPWEVTRALKVRDFREFQKIEYKNTKFPRKMGKSHYFCPKNTKNFHSKVQTKSFSKKIRDFPRFWGLLLVARDYSDF